MAGLPNRGKSGAGNEGSYAVGAVAVACGGDGHSEMTLQPPTADQKRAMYAAYASTDYPDDAPLALGITEDDRERYTHSDCQQLAIALHEKTGWPYVALCDDANEETGTFGWMHMGVQTPDGRFMDVEGPGGEYDVFDAYGDLSEAEDGDSWLEVSDTTAPFSVDPAKEMSPENAADANRVADALLAAYRNG